MGHIPAYCIWEVQSGSKIGSCDTELYDICGCQKTQIQWIGFRGNWTLKAPWSSWEKSDEFPVKIVPYTNPLNVRMRPIFIYTPSLVVCMYLDFLDAHKLSHNLKSQIHQENDH